MNDTDRLARRALTLIDLTDLSDTCDSAAIAKLCTKAVTSHGKVAAVCVWPRCVAAARRQLEGTGVRIATVANFPHGGDDLQAAVADVVRGYAEGADEVDIVIPYRRLLAGDEASVERLIAAAVERRPAGQRLKAILETGELGHPELIDKAARIAIAAGVDFIKTSTGKTKVSATPEAVKIMLAAIRESGSRAGIKPSGGIRSLQDASLYYHLARNAMGTRWVKPATFRFGASGLLDDILAYLERRAVSASEAAY
jgi:deoxyribose-phosphate aldolase